MTGDEPADDRRAALWGLVAEHATARGAPVSVADVGAVVVSVAGVSGGWVTAASGRGPDFVVRVTDAVSERLAEMAMTLGEGPCHDITVSGAPVLAGDLGDDLSGRRWPVFAAEALRLGAAAVFSFPLTIGVIRAGVMGLYRASPGPLSGPQLRDCLLLADTATVLLLEGQGHRAADGDGNGTGPDGDGAEFLAGEAPDLALHRAEVDQATGMLTVQLDVTAAEAFVRLRAYAYAQDRRLADVARDIVTRRLRLFPDPPASSAR